MLVTGDFNPRSTGFDANHVKRLVGLSQIIKVATRGDVILDWCLTNSKDNILQSVQLPPIGTSDHYTILMKGQAPLIKPDNSPGNAILETAEYALLGGISPHLIGPLF